MAVSATCGGSTTGKDLDPYLCQPGDVGEEYQELTRGNFSPRDLADLGPSADRREDEFEEGGMERGRFVFYKQSLPKPPFDPPIDVLCQVLEFENEGAAAAFVAGLEPSDSVATTNIAWIPEDNWQFVERDYPELEGPGGRSFEVTAGRGEQQVAAILHTRASGRFVATIAAGRTQSEVTDELREVLSTVHRERAQRLGKEPWTR